MAPWSRVIVLLTVIYSVVRSTPITTTLQSEQKLSGLPQISEQGVSHESLWCSIYGKGCVNRTHQPYQVDYTGAQVLKVSIGKDEWRAFIISELEHQNLITTWSAKFTDVDVFVPAHEIQKVKLVLRRENIPFEVVIRNLQVLINQETPPLDENYNKLQAYRDHNMDWKRYHRLADIHGFLDYLAKTYPTIVTVQSIGKSYEGRDMKLLKISNGNPSNKAVFIDGGIHAREWISPATVTYFINQFAGNFSAETDDIKNIDWYFLPVLNPDGYEFTHTSDRMWRKNRRPNPDPNSCPGVDLNRNFGYKWGGAGTSGHPCSEIYRGEAAFSEPESKAVRDFIQSSGVKFALYLTYHSYGQYVLYPWGYDQVLPSDAGDLDAAGKSLAAAIKATGQDTYTVGSSATVLYAAAGGSDDWAKSIGIKYSYTIELNDQGRYGFVLPPQYIEPVANENLAGLRAMAAVIHKA